MQWPTHLQCARKTKTYPATVLVAKDLQQPNLVACLKKASLQTNVIGIAAVEAAQYGLIIAINPRELARILKKGAMEQLAENRN